MRYCRRRQPPRRAPARSPLTATMIKRRHTRMLSRMGREEGEAAQSTGAATSALQLLCVSEIVERVLVILQSSG
ncbi:hypothetical protein [Oryza sativa Japonica Group]|uniref:Uncharacterized protein n=1 Tax=Oryza sativa subsp. japonica TaxID=39947 RepID=Q5NBG0_ORYSJ|nr:hypothetical protein [Oryza sativa Japonica Group]